MTLGTKTLLGLGASFAFWCMLLYWANSLLLRPSFAALEERNLERNCERARNAIAGQSLTLCSKVGDWSLWDDTYDYIETRSPTYLEANLNPESMETLDLDFMAFIDKRGEIVHIALRQEGVGKVVQATAVRTLLFARPRLLQHDDVRSRHHGMVELGGHLLLLASRPIHRSDLTGDSRGSLIAGRIFDARVTDSLSSLTQMQLQIEPSSSPLTRTRITRDDERIRGTIGLNDAFGQPIATCSVSMPREIHHEGEAALRLLLVALLVSSGLALLTTLGGIDRAVLRRLRNLSSSIHDIATTQDLSRRVVATGSDEISDLADSINDLTAQLHETQRCLIQANQARSQFLANVSHEVRTPVTALLGFIDLLQDPELPRAQHEDFVRTIRSNAQHLLTILNDLLDTAKIESGQMAVEVMPTDLPTILLDSIELVRPTATRKGVALHLQQDTPIPRTIATDPTRLRQILANLLSNALKFTEHGSVHLIASLTDEQTLLLQVKDTGIGISAEQQQRLFAPFVQADATTSRRFGGTGLGLALSRSLARCLGGDVTLQSREGQGSTFSLTLQIGSIAGAAMETSLKAATRTSCATATAALKFDLTTRRVLVVDDALDNRRLVSFVLSKAGASVDTAENGRIGVDRVLAAEGSGQPYDLVIMDMQMPVLDGYGATIELRERGQELPILALTANAIQADLEACLLAGCSDYATKPIDRHRLLEVTQTLIAAGEELSSHPPASPPSPAHAGASCWPVQPS